MRRTALALAVLISAAVPLAAQQGALFGTWQTITRTKDGPHSVIVRPDSSASYGTQTVRWRIQKAGKILLALGGEWVEYDYKVKGEKLTLSGGDLKDPITLKRLGPPTPRAAGIDVPPDPDSTS
ncbi:MAG TPA: hypothetical protein VLC11_08370 [Gemmatimonadales bacterium]|nr:hypothetical protein [Gemmatimonadales bacterium]